MDTASDGMNQQEYKFKTLEYGTVMKYMIGPDKVKRTVPYPSFDKIPLPPKDINEIRLEAVMGSCAFKATLGLVSGYGLGALMGLFT